MALIAVASNNVVCINKDQNLFDSKKKMKAALNEALVYKLPSRQRKYIALNNAILNYYINQTELCEKICKNIEDTYPDLMIQILILRALNLIKADKVKEAIELLKKTERQDNRLYLHLCIAQIHLMQGERQEACKVLENLGEHSYKPGIVGALTTLYLGLGDEQMALKVFQRTVEYYKRNEITKAGLSSLWRQAAEFHIKKGLPQVAANSLEELLKTDSNDRKLIAQLILACSQFDIPRALELSKRLPDVKDIAKDVDIEALLVSTLNAPTYSKKSPAVKQDSLPSTPRDEGKKKKTDKHKKRKGKLPLNYDPNVGPDPERWLARHERTGYRKKRDRRSKEVIKGSQGTTSAQAEQYDFSKFVEDNASTSAPMETTPKGSKAQPSQSKKGQKKGKSKRR
ncbi:unnamed protein product [Callosobruchus maculatus]|uniref:Signal recognition particle subunit SRP72 n=1 Tax=Callosobruchus maculatus TaxID=64391 RepID=A0A653DW99_CALMS|nr:unnamed protein product [Callosobruchus maculatus]